MGMWVRWLGLQYGQGHEDARAQWKSRKLLGVVLCVLLVLPGLAACTPAMPVSGEAAMPAMVGPPAGPWPRQLTSGDNTFSIFQPHVGTAAQYQLVLERRQENDQLVAMQEAPNDDVVIWTLWAPWPLF